MPSAAVFVWRLGDNNSSRSADALPCCCASHKTEGSGLIGSSTPQLYRRHLLQQLRQGVAVSRGVRSRKHHPTRQCIPAASKLTAQHVAHALLQQLSVAIVLQRGLVPARVCVCNCGLAGCVGVQQSGVPIQHGNWLLPICCQRERDRSTCTMELGHGCTPNWCLPGRASLVARVSFCVGLQTAALAAVCYCGCVCTRRGRPELFTRHEDRSGRQAGDGIRFRAHATGLASYLPDLRHTVR